jgi:hypothetical protein
MAHVTDHSTQGKTKSTNEDALPQSIENYLHETKLEPTVNAIVNKVLKERPANPLE